MLQGMADYAISRDRSPLAVLLDPQNDIPISERDIREEDYLNDKIQTSADLGSLESLVATVEAQKKLLEEQLQDATSKLLEAKEASRNRTSSMFAQTQEFERQQASVQDRLLIVTNSEAPEEATALLRRPLEMIRRLELTTSYFELLKEVENLKEEARQNLPANPKEALKPYTRLKELALSLQELQEPAEGAAVHLTTHVQNASVGLWAEMKKIMSDEFETALKKSNWPDSASEPTKEWGECFEKLLDLQAPEIMAAREPLVLLPMSVLAKNFVLQFRYHFFSDKPTNHPHQLGDYFFEWFLGTVSKWEDFLRENVGPLLAVHFRGNSLAGNALYVDPVAAFITALLPVMKEKVDILVIEISKEPQFLSRFMVQLMNFDEAVRARFHYDGGNPQYGWKGLTWEVADTWFDRWLQVEKDFALERYHEILKSQDNGVIDYDSSAPGKTKPTYGATRVTDLILTVTLQYNKLRRFSHKVKFLINIQAEILDLYMGRLKDSLDVYQTITSTVGRTLHGVSKEQQASLEGIGGLESLCKVFGSAEHLISMLKAWSNEEFFVDLWEQLQGRARITTVEDNLAGEMTYTEIKQVTSEAVGSEDEGSVFDVTIDGFQRIRNRAESLIVQALKYRFPTDFRQYLLRPQWTTIGEISSSNKSLDLALTAELDQPLHLLKQNMGFLHKTLADAPFRRIWRQALESLEDLLHNDVLLKQDFTTLGAVRFMYDVAEIQNAIDYYASRSSALGMPKLKEGVALLNLAIDPEDGRMSLKAACQEIFASNQQAQNALEAIGITRLSNHEARSILARRVEANGD